MRVLLLGARSQLGHDILRTWRDHAITALGREQCDVTDPAAVRAALETARPELVVSLAASHRVDDLERDPAPALLVNGYGAWAVARATADNAIPVMWISTDYVFSGEKTEPYGEDDPVGPLSLYGASKAAGERLIAIANPRHYVVRSSGLYGVAGSSGKGGNFVETMLTLARAGRQVRVVGDQVLGPTNTHDLAAALEAIARQARYGTYHATNQGEISWHDFAALIFSLCGIRVDLQRITSEEFGAPARRPAYSVLRNGVLASAGIPPLPPIADALRRYLAEKGYLQS
jgi:dTDP-4-dehydrorhamnose reductase